MSNSDFMDWFFEILNETEEGILGDIDVDLRNSSFHLTMMDSSHFVIECRKSQ